MARSCAVTGKRPTTGFKYAIRGIAKKKKGIGLKVTGKTKRWFRPNLVKKRFWDPEKKQFVKMTVSMNAMRTMEKHGVSAVVKAMKAQGIAA